MLAHKPNPALLAPPGAYLTDGDQLVRVLESDHSGALGEDCLSDEPVNIEPGELGPGGCWRRVTPAADEDAPA